MKKLFTLLALSLTTFVGKSQILVEDFDYTVGDTINILRGWVFNSSYVNPITVTSPGLTFTGFPGSGIGNAVTLTNNGQDLYKQASASITSGNVYGSFMINVTAAQATGDYFFAFTTPSSGSAYTARTFIKSSGAGFVVGISKINDPAPVYGTTVYDLNKTYVMVVKYNYATASATDDQASVFVFDGALPSTEPTTPAAGPTAATGADATALNRVALRQGTAGNAPSFIIDGIRMADSWTTVLPVTLKSISASLINNQPQVNWETSNETNFDYFGVEKSFDAKNFAEIARVASNKASNGSSYQYADINKTLSTQFYRLKMVDNDGTFKYSSVVAVNAKPTISLALYPNPVTNTIILSHPKAIAGAAVKVTSIDGKILSTQNVQTGATQTSIDATRLVKGNYVVSFVNDGVASTTQLVKQ
jgi:hypothetical protein